MQIRSWGALTALFAVVAMLLTACGTAASQRTSAPVPTVTVPASPTAPVTQAPPTTTQPARPPPSKAASGIRGITVITHCAVTTEGGCPQIPVRAHIVVLDRSGANVSTVDSGADGRFSLTVKPGDYTLRASSIDGALPRPFSETVTVHIGQMLNLTIIMDSGIRLPA